MSEEKKEKKRQTNRDYAKENKHFQECCSRAETEPTVRQASKFRRKLGLAYSKGKK